MKLSVFWGFYILLFLCISCKKKEVKIRTEPVVQSFQVQLPDILKFNSHKILDTEITGMIAFRCLIPEKWAGQDKVEWDSTDQINPVRWSGIYLDSTRSMKIQIYPDQRSSYTIGPKGLHGKKPPVHVLEGIKELIKKRRSDQVYEVVYEKAFDAPKPQNTEYISETSQIGIVRIEYEEKNQKIEEEFYGNLSTTELSSESYIQMHTMKWMFDELYSCKAPKGKLEFCRAMAFTLKSSEKRNLAFYNKVNHLLGRISELGFQNAIREEQNLHARESGSNDVTAQNSNESDFQNLEQQQMNNNSTFSKYLGGIDMYKDDDIDSAYFPAGYNLAWKSEPGDYILSRVNNFDPNGSASGNWKLMVKY